MGYYHLEVRHGAPLSASIHYDYTHRLGAYKRRSDLQFSESGNLPRWAESDPRYFWQSADRYERRTGRPYMGVEAALSSRASPNQRIALVREFVDHLVGDRHAYSWAIHGPDPTGAGPHPHVHLMLSTRIRDGINRDPRPYFASPLFKDPYLRGSGKERRLSNPHAVNRIRSAWAYVANDFYERQGIDERIDERSHRQRGLLLEPKMFEDYGESGAQNAVGRARREFNRGRVERNVERLFIRPEVVLDAISAEQAVFTRPDIERVIRRLTMTKLQYQGVLMKVLTLPELVDLAPSDGSRLPRFTTRALRDLGPSVSAQAIRLASPPVGHRDGADLPRPGPEGAFTPEQRAAVEQMASARGLAALSGPPGSGRSTVLRAAREILAEHGNVVLGTAPGERAAAALQRETGIESVSLSTLLRHIDQGKMPASPPAVLVVEDAALLEIRTLKKLLDHIEQHGGSLRLVAETQQLRSTRAVEAFGRIERAASAAGASTQLALPLRQQSDWQRTAGIAGSGEALFKALEAYAEKGQLQAFAGEAAVAEGLLARWVQDRADHPGQTQLLLTDTEEQRRRMNRAARSLLRQRGELGPGVEFHQRSHYLQVAVGERLRFTRSRHSEGIEAGMLASLIGMDADGWRIRLDMGRTYTIPPDLQDSTDYGYALSIAAAQGMTVDRTYLLASSNLDATATRVALTRHRQSAYIGYSTMEFQEPSVLFSALARDEPRWVAPASQGDRGPVPDRATPSQNSGRIGTWQSRDDTPGNDAGRGGIGGNPASTAAATLSDDRLERWQDARSERLRRSLTFADRGDPRRVRDPDHQRDRDPERDPEIDR